jgi:MinD-like ATPase involved in chromosome partitioning or flagellar assembly
MDPKTVRRLEKRLYNAIADVICDMGLKKLPLLPSQHTMEMMAKAATAVYEAAEENHRRSHGPASPRGID